MCELRQLVPMAGVGLCRNYPFSRSLPTSFSTVAIKNLKINRESSHVLVKSGVVYYKPARTFFKVRLYIHACIYACIYCQLHAHKGMCMHASACMRYKYMQGRINAREGLCMGLYRPLSNVSGNRSKRATAIAI